jgi:ABC-type antimicrobial peptide transport system permease subunit
MLGRSIYLAARAAVDPTTTLALMRAHVAALNPDLAVREAQRLRDRVDSALAPPRFRAVLMGSFAALALLLAAVGLYGVIAFAVSQRTQESGVRMALGAGPVDIARMVLRDGLRLTVLGVGLGVAGALIFSRLIERMLFGVSPRDTWTFVAISLVLGIVAILASYLPARRASLIEPMRALRTE